MSSTHRNPFRTWTADQEGLTTEQYIAARAQRDRIRASRRQAQADVRAARAERDARATVAAGFAR